MSGKGTTHSHLSRGLVTDLTKHNDVRILTQESPEGHRKVKADFLLQLHLIHAFQSVLDRILDCDDVVVPSVKQLQRRVKRGTLSGSGRSANQDHSVRMRDCRQIIFVLTLVKSQFGKG